MRTRHRHDRIDSLLHTRTWFSTTQKIALFVFHYAWTRSAHLHAGTRALLFSFQRPAASGRPALIGQAHELVKATRGRKTALRSLEAPFYWVSRTVFRQVRRTSPPPGAGVRP